MIKNNSRSNLNLAAKRIAKTLEMSVASRVDEETHRMHIVWQLKGLETDSSRVAYIRLTCEKGYGAQGDWWSGFVSITESTMDRDKTIGSKCLLEPFGKRDREKACKDTRKAFCAYAEKFKPQPGMFV